jgi:hypothetical protein
VLRGHSFTVIGNANVLVCMPPSEKELASVVKVLKPGEGGDLHLLGRSVITRLTSPGDSKPVVKQDHTTTP